MRSDMKPGARFPDHVLPDHTRVPRRLSRLQSDQRMVVVLTRGAFCPKGRNLEIQSIHSGCYHWNRPSMAELHLYLREATRGARSDWDITEPDLREAWDRGERIASGPYGGKSMEEMAGGRSVCRSRRGAGLRRSANVGISAAAAAPQGETNARPDRSAPLWR